MKVFISADIEGVAGFSTFDAGGPKDFEWERARRWMTDEVVVAARAALAAGAAEVIVADSHGNAQNILVEALPERVRLVRGWPRPLLQMQGVEEPGVEAAVLIGYHGSTHAPSGTLCHTYFGWRAIRLNGVTISESYGNAALAGAFGVPVVAISGDEAAVAETRAWLPEIEAAIVKRAYGWRSVITTGPAEAHRLIADAVTRGIQRRTALAPLVLPGPITVELEFNNRIMVEIMELMPQFQRMDPYTIRYVAADMVEAMRFIVFTQFMGKTHDPRYTG
ncbi:MAG TPA: M55 family metallopeptidase [Azospirillaceae bacterium]|nr:M55 family metallopeptidase [Azospirillaceae bacterium]